MPTQVSMSLMLQRMPPAGMDAMSGTTSPSSRIGTLPAAVRMCGWATLPTRAGRQLPTWQRPMPSGPNSCSRTSTS
jgi:hypothetical protein